MRRNARVTNNYILSVVEPTVCCASAVQVYDLLDLTSEGMSVHWDSKAKTFEVRDLLPVECNSYDDVMTVVSEGGKNRSIRSTALNKDSSRSHRYDDHTRHISREDHKAVA